MRSSQTLNRNGLRFLIYPYWNVNIVINCVLCFLANLFLIYPYWNVNYKKEDGLSGLGYVSNLSILECKFYKSIYIQASYLVSNLSILECKLLRYKYPPLFLSVSNLSILECKCRICHFKYSLILCF